MEYKISALNLDNFHRSIINLINNAIIGDASSIAIRLNIKNHRIQIIDNSIGLSFNNLRIIGENCRKKHYLPSNNNTNMHYNYLCHENYRNIVNNYGAVIIISSKYINSRETYKKILKNANFSREFQQISNRPTHGTTLTIYYLNNILKNNFNPSIIVNSINNLAKYYHQISFSIRDDDNAKIILKLKKKYKIKQIKKNYNIKSTIHTFTISSSIIMPKKSIINTQLTNNKSLFNYTFNSNNINNNKLSINEINTIPNEFISKINDQFESIPSQWSDWNYKSPLSLNNSSINLINHTNINELRRYKFLPAKLTKLLTLNTDNKLINRKLTQEFITHGVFNNLSRRQDFNIRPCNKLQKLIQSKITLERDSLKNMEVLNQINSEFIAATVLQNGKKLLILIDQHAMHERIRYENLLKDYKNNKNEFISIKLRRVIKIDNIPINYIKLIQNNYKLYMNFGLKIIKNTKINSSIIIEKIPKCFIQKKTNNINILISLIRQLIMEIIDKLINGIGFNNLPIIIHNTIALEACHGAIKFGDTLNKHQCNIMVNYWKNTNLPNRCAHGRPVIIPLLSIDI